MAEPTENAKTGPSFKDFVSMVGTPLAIVGGLLAIVSQYGHRIGLVLAVVGFVLILLGAGWMLVKRMLVQLVISVTFAVAITLAFYVGRWTAPQALAAAPTEMTAQLISYTTPASSRAVPFSLDPRGIVNVPNEITVDGIVTNMDKQSVLWVVNIEDGSPNYYIHNGPCSIPATQVDRFYCSNQFIGGKGSDIHTRWRISVVRVTLTQSQMWSAQLAEGNPMVGVLPSGVTILGTTSVMRI